jgi:hypothetical protein
MFVQQLNGDFAEMLDARTARKPKFEITQDERGNKRMNVPLVMMDHDNTPAQNIQATKERAWQAMVKRVCDAWKAPMHVPGSAADSASKIDGIENYVGRDGYVEWQRNAWKR